MTETPVKEARWNDKFKVYVGLCPHCDGPVFYQKDLKTLCNCCRKPIVWPPQAAEALAEYKRTPKWSRTMRNDGEVTIQMEVTLPLSEFVIDQLPEGCGKCPIGYMFKQDENGRDMPSGCGYRGLRQHPEDYTKRPDGCKLRTLMDYLRETDRDTVRRLISKVALDSVYDEGPSIECSTGYGGVSFDFDDQGELKALYNYS